MVTAQCHGEAARELADLDAVTTAGSNPGGVGQDERCHRCAKPGPTVHGLCFTCTQADYLNDQKQQPRRATSSRPHGQRVPLTSIELVNELIRCGSRDLLDLAKALGYDNPLSLAQRLRRIAATIETQAGRSAFGDTRPVRPARSSPAAATVRPGPSTSSSKTTSHASSTTPEKPTLTTSISLGSSSVATNPRQGHDGY